MAPSESYLIFEFMSPLNRTEYLSRLYRGSFCCHVVPNFVFSPSCYDELTLILNAHDLFSVPEATLSLEAITPHLPINTILSNIE